MPCRSSKHCYGGSDITGVFVLLSRPRQLAGPESSDLIHGSSQGHSNVTDHTSFIPLFISTLAMSGRPSRSVFGIEASENMYNQHFPSRGERSSRARSNHCNRALQTNETIKKTFQPNYRYSHITLAHTTPNNHFPLSRLYATKDQCFD